MAKSLPEGLRSFAAQVFKRQDHKYNLSLLQLSRMVAFNISTLINRYIEMTASKAGRSCPLERVRIRVYTFYARGFRAGCCVMIFVESLGVPSMSQFCHIGGRIDVVRRVYSPKNWYHRRYTHVRVHTHICGIRGKRLYTCVRLKLEARTTPRTGWNIKTQPWIDTSGVNCDASQRRRSFYF